MQVLLPGVCQGWLVLAGAAPGSAPGNVELLLDPWSCSWVLWSCPWICGAAPGICGAAPGSVELLLDPWSCSWVLWSSGSLAGSLGWLHAQPAPSGRTGTPGPEPQHSLELLLGWARTSWMNVQCSLHLIFNFFLFVCCLLFAPLTYFPSWVQHSPLCF